MYNQLDWLIPWYADDYIPFNPAQEILLGVRLEQYLRWHRQEQLPQYADFLDAVADAMVDGLTVTELEQFELQARALSGQLIDQSVPYLVELLQQLDDDQVAELFANLEQRNQRYRERYLEASDQSQRRQRAKDMRKFIQRWTGVFDEAQNKRVQQWSKTYHRMGEVFLSSRLTWQKEFQQLLDQRTDRDQFEPALRQLVLRPLQREYPAAQAQYDDNRRLIRELYVDIDRSLSTEQRQLALRRLRSYAADFRELAADIDS